MNVYLEAASLLRKIKPAVRCDRTTRACVAIRNAKYSAAKHAFRPSCQEVKEAGRFTALFAPRDDAHAGQNWLVEHDLEGANAHEWRLTALCFAAAMHDTGDL